MKGVKRTLVRLWGRIVCRLHEMASWVVAGFCWLHLLTLRESEQGGAVGKSAGVLLLVLWNVSPSKD